MQLKFPNSVCLLYGIDLHYLDHLAPLAAQINAPLIVTDVEIEETALQFYPDVNIQYVDLTDIHHHIIHNYDDVISCFTRRHFETYFGLTEDLLEKKCTFIWCPHGNSDKDNLGILKKEAHLLVYGKQMQKRINTSAQTFMTGNYRYHYYLEHKEFYRFLLEKQISELDASSYLFYAPTWEDYENNSSVSCISSILEHLPPKYNLVVKFHPNTWIEKEFEIERLIYTFKNKKNFLFLRNFPPVFPILERASAFIGDVSSIGYDFLFFKRPMIFLDKKKRKLPLFKCGSVVSPNNVKQIYKLLETPEYFRKFHFEQEKLRLKAFHE